MSQTRAAQLAWALWGLSAALLVGEVVFAILNRGTEIPGSFGPFFDAFFRLAVLVFVTVGALVASRRPGNPIGWLLVSVGVPFALSGFAHSYATYTLLTEPGSLRGVDVMAWLAAWLFLPPLFAIPPLLFLLFPNGRLLSPRWRPVALLIAVGAVATALSTAFAPGFLAEPPFEGVVNPFGLEGAGGFLDAISILGWVSIVVGIPAAAVSMLLRLRRARGIERQQLKWIATAAALFAVACLGAATTFSLGGEELGQIMVLMAYSAFPVAAGYAILRHRLYDIDVVVNRTLVYGSVTALLAGAYLGLVLLFQLAFQPVTEGNGLAVAFSTLAVAALFRPARNYVQRAVDRRFYRRRYDAQRTLEGFATRLRDEIDLDALRVELTGVVAQTMQPAHVSLWLREAQP
jgi:hypothetical protein